MNVVPVARWNGAWAFGLSAVGALILLAAFGARSVLAMARRRDEAESKIPPLRAADKVRTYRILAGNSDELLLRTPGLTALIHGTSDADPAKTTETKGEDSFMVRTTGDS